MSSVADLPGTEWERILKLLLDRWEENDQGFSGRKGVSTPQALGTFALAAHTHRLARSVLALRDLEMYLESVPLTREAFQFALTAQWIAQYQPAVSGFINESSRQHNATIKTILETGWKGAADSEDSRQLGTPARGKSFTDQSARNFSQLCDDLQPGGTEAYAIYRIMSSYTHPGYRVVDQYIKDDPLLGFTYPTNFNKEDSLPWLHVTCISVVWAARAVDMLDREHPNRAELRTFAKTLGVRPELQLSAAFKQREQAARRAKWKPPRQP
ncbi:DUF5677 domain-containing protein [Lentzea albidocapillata]|uniref:Uncharacterized protein n=1 Tax=Lentzea albidocapillata TaxID=40571 RepID=A0A1W2CK26_9PSEU|nr:DUF5677 domain-containing protein [Lentzea albidocapillata]SMC85563.1 hypothetical protein SAMN05660733_02124 [Lentzea albidocapillata]